MGKRKIILFHPRTYHERNYRYYHIPYSLLSITSPLDSRKFEVILIDDNVVKKEDFINFILESNNELLCVGISSLVGAQIKYGLRFAKQVREADNQIPIIWGGPLPTMLPEMTVSHELVDIAVRGQGEITFSEIVYRLKQNLCWENLLGISYKNNGRVIHNPDRPFEDLNKFPPYRKVYRLIDVRNYIRPDEHISSRTVSYHSSQGCPYGCGFCCDVPLWKRWWSGLSPSRMLNDIQYLIERYKIDGIKFYDSEFFINLKRALIFAKKLLKNGIEIKWGASIHPRNLFRIKDDQLSLLVESGLRRLLIGIESGVQIELDLIRKNVTTEMVFDLAERCSFHGIIASFSFIIGYPSMPDENVDKTLAFAQNLMKNYPEHESKLHLYAPYPGTPLYSLAIQCGFNPPQTLNDWLDYDYYEVTTPWAKLDWVEKIRQFNENFYPYAHHYPYKWRRNQK